jgi:hypothetical protein
LTLPPAWFRFVEGSGQRVLEGDGFLTVSLVAGGFVHRHAGLQVGG